ncbi:MAG: 4Fe-4S binding protein, partial [Halanaerobiales bacterium]|nr:4Fe-4S binding protein [Halanaerobiales bacterium]
NSERKAKIDYDKCVDCGSCIRACPFGAISDSTEIVNVCRSIKNDKQKLTALLAPSFVGQFGAKVKPETIKSALKEIGFDEVIEVGLGADLVAVEESKELKEKIMEDDFLLSSCCPSFKRTVEKHFEKLKPKVSQTVSPMVKIAEKVKDDTGNKTVFIGPCISKKAESCKYESVDHVLTFEELMCIMVAANMNLASYDKKEGMKDSSRHGRQFAFSGGLSKVMHELTENDIKTVKGNGLDECQKLLNDIISKEKEIDFMEGMACQGGCAGGPANLNKAIVTKKLVELFSNQAEYERADQNEYPA